MFSIKRFSSLIIIFLFALTSFGSSAFGISRSKVIRDFKSQYKIPSNRKIKKIKYKGSARRFYKWLGSSRVLHKSYKVNVDNYFEECGLKVRYFWRVWYAKIGGKWTFQKIVIHGHKQTKKPTKKSQLTEIDSDKAIKNSIGGSGSWSYRVISTKILSKRLQKWEFCRPIYDVKAKIQILGGEQFAPYHNVYSCTLNGEITKLNNKLGITNVKCYDKKGKLNNFCHYSSMCKITGKKLNAPPAPKWSAKMQKKMGAVIIKKFNSHYSVRGLKLTGLTLLQKPGKIRVEGRGVYSDWFGNITLTLPYAENYALYSDSSQPKQVTAKFICKVRVSKKYSNGGWWWKDSIGCAKPGTNGNKYSYCGNAFESCKCVGPNKNYCFHLRKNKKGPCGKNICPNNWGTALTPAKSVVTVAKPAKAKKTVTITSKYKVKCSNKMFKSGNSTGSLITWANNYMKLLNKALKDQPSKLGLGGIVNACKKVLGYYGCVYCRNKNSKQGNRLLKTAVMACKVIYKARIESHCYDNIHSCNSSTKGLRYLRTLIK
jgi:hypothetical protein